ncbi:phosphatidylglycerophosphatase and protein-tyrosine phosphatase 1-like isoform X3 [Octopus sinensis]|uniref:Phosphatidylglycerophosphatase and protein-tyrosine phosphatase 1-like isoform X3 n=1 Tax=Octopus sinensis TaxID=2607531 RepID=A0A7E6FHB5_9MOLL|nr:phosphatidylglycerophosphatase and protein-tyrosine phosphatase 1-like isoform X3 [Octopus sinensis]
MLTWVGWPDRAAPGSNRLVWHSFCGWMSFLIPTTLKNVQRVLFLWCQHGKEWKDLGVGFLQVEVEDFIGTPSLWQVTQALAFISYYQQLGQCVYVHCKAGRTRSAIIVACYLMMKNQWDDTTAWNHILSRCTHVRLTQQQQQFLHFFYLTETSMQKLRTR